MSKNSIVFSGRTTYVDSNKRAMVLREAQKGKNIVFMDYHHNDLTREYRAVRVSLGDLIPFLDGESCVRMFSDFGRMSEGDSFRFLAERFITLFQKLTTITDARLLDMHSWSMLGLLNDSRPEMVEMSRLLDNNYSSLPALENYFSHIANMIQTTGVDIRQAVKNHRPLYFHLDPSACNTGDLKKTVTHLVGSIVSLFPPEETTVITDEIPSSHSDLFSDLLFHGGYNTMMWFEDLFVLPRHFQSTVLNSAEKVVFFKHRSPQSIRGICECLGMQEMHDVTVTCYPERRPFDNRMLRPIWNDLSIQGGPDRRNAGYSVSKKERPLMREDEIAMLGENEAIVLAMADRSYTIVNVT